MRHQISFVGKQILPVYVGIKELNPDKVHLIASNESKDGIALIKPFFGEQIFSEHICNAHEFYTIKDTCEKIILELGKNDEVAFNLTGGTKVMLLAAQALIQKYQCLGYYINPDNTVLKVPSYTLQDLTCEITIKIFLELSGHKLNSFKPINEVKSSDFSAASTIETFANENTEIFGIITKYFRNNYNNVGKQIPKTGSLEFDNNITFEWTEKSAIVQLNKINILSVSSSNIRRLLFLAEWWELVVAKEISKWTKFKELFVQCELPFKGDSKRQKNEIDILINLGRKLIFVECKSGAVRQEDIYKIKAIKDTYGGVISKSILISRFKPDQYVIEKCDEMDIGVFYVYDNNNLVHPLDEIINILDSFERKLAM